MRIYFRPGFGITTQGSGRGFWHKQTSNILDS